MMCKLNKYSKNTLTNIEMSNFYGAKERKTGKSPEYPNGDIWYDNDNNGKLSPGDFICDRDEVT